MTKDGVTILIERALRQTWHTAFSKSVNIPRATEAIVTMLMEFNALNINDSNNENP